MARAEARAITKLLHDMERWNFQGFFRSHPLKKPKIVRKAGPKVRQHRILIIALGDNGGIYDSHNLAKVSPQPGCVRAQAPIMGEVDIGI